MKETASESVMAGAAMGRRATYQFGTALSPGPKGQMGSGIGPGLAGGEITLIPPTDTVFKTGETRTVDGVAEVNDVFLDDVEVPVEQRVGAENQGWTIAKYLLVHERGGSYTPALRARLEVAGRGMSVDLRSDGAAGAEVLSQLPRFRCPGGW